MTPPIKRPGIFTDPWRTATAAAVVPVLEQRKAKAVASAVEEFEEDISDPKHATLELKGYGGITVDGVSAPLNAAAQILKFCVENKSKIEQTLLQYGIILVKMSQLAKLTTKFYIQRDDGWTLAIPDASTRDNGCLQLIQALLEINSDPAMKGSMQHYRIRPYKM